MSAADWKPGRETAERALRGAAEVADSMKDPKLTFAQATWDRQAITALGIVAAGNALLAVEERLGELVEQQRTAVMLAAFQSSAIRNDRDYVAARDAVRRLLDLDPITTADSAEPLRQAREQIAERLTEHRDTSTRNPNTNEYKNPARQGYDMALSEVLAILDAQIGDKQ